MKFKQIIVPAANQVELREAEQEFNLEADEILIETEASFISPGTELAIFQAKTERVYQKGAWCEYPWRAGYANVGTIVRVGSGVTKFKPGQRVFTHGQHASMIVVKQDKMIVEVPDNLDSGTAAATRLASISATSLYVTDIPTNAWVAVYGLGMIGNMASQIFQLMGCKVIGIDPNGFRRELAEKCGIRYTVSGNENEVLERIKKFTNGQMCHISIDAVGHSLVIKQALKSTANHGQVILLGTPRVPIEGNLTEVLAEVHLRWLTLRGALNFMETSKLLEIQKNTFDWVNSGRLILDPIISHRLLPEQIAQAYDGLLHKQEEYTGVVLRWKE
ncbi:zinc-binding dehydrogenase [Paenibacillus sp. tmac-D7]|uniref:zinc-binding dehydrogenase n=1 Tax=Paenibacillus sp. tmac-D7 TaxID=2591462 RepID=UPI0015E84284|nr:zinc-binding dehydrogenase [Paenibacillus sp. tmac-D7]